MRPLDPKKDFVIFERFKDMLNVRTKEGSVHFIKEFIKPTYGYSCKDKLYAYQISRAFQSSDPGDDYHLYRENIIKTMDEVGFERTKGKSCIDDIRYCARFKNVFINEEDDLSQERFLIIRDTKGDVYVFEKKNSFIPPASIKIPEIFATLENGFCTDLKTWEEVDAFEQLLKSIGIKELNRPMYYAKTLPDKEDSLANVCLKMLLNTNNKQFSFHISSGFRNVDKNITRVSSKTLYMLILTSFFNIKIEN